MVGDMSMVMKEYFIQPYFMSNLNLTVITEGFKNVMMKLTRIHFSKKKVVQSEI